MHINGLNEVLYSVQKYSNEEFDILRIIGECGIRDYKAKESSIAINGTYANIMNYTIRGNVLQIRKFKSKLEASRLPVIV